jgi:hypothetical protein
VQTMREAVLTWLRHNHRRGHKRVNTTVIAVAISCRERDTIRLARVDSAAPKLSSVTGHRMGRLRFVLPDHCATRSDRDGRGGKVEDSIFIRGN